MTVVAKEQYPLSSPGEDGRIIPLQVSRPEQLFSLCFTQSPMATALALNTAWDILEFWSTEPCLIAFDSTPVVLPDGIGTTVPGAYLIGVDKADNKSVDRIILTKTADFLSVVGLGNPGELFVSVLTRYEAIAIDESLSRG